MPTEGTHVARSCDVTALRRGGHGGIRRPERQRRRGSTQGGRNLITEPATGTTAGHVTSHPTGPAQALRAAKVAAARPVIDRYVDDPRVQAVYCSGSLFADLGTPFSDVDLFVVTDTPLGEGHPTGHYGTTQHRVGDERVDVEYRPSRWLDDLSAVAAPFTATLTNPGPLRAAEKHLDDAVRLRYSEVYKNSTGLDAARAALVDGDTNLRQLIVAAATVDLGNAWEDCLGFLLAGDHDSASLRAGRVHGHALDALCAARGDLYRGEKWIWPRVRRHPELVDGDRLTAPYLTPAEPVAATTLVARRLLAAQEAAGWAMLHAWRAPGPTEGWAFPVPNAVAFDSPATRPRTPGPLRSPYWQPVRLADMVLLVDRDIRHYAVPELALLCWLNADGGERAQLEERIHASAEGLLGITPEPALVRTTLDDLLRLGALVTGAAWGALLAPDRA